MAGSRVQGLSSTLPARSGDPGGPAGRSLAGRRGSAALLWRLAAAGAGLLLALPLHADGPKAPPGMAVEEALEILWTARTQAPLVWRAYEVLQGGVVVGTVEVFEQGPQSGVERRPVDGDPSPDLVLGSPLRILGVRGSERRVVGAGPVLLAELRDAYDRGVAAWSRRHAFEVPAGSPWWQGIVAIPPAPGTKRTPMGAFQVISGRGVLAPHLAEVRDGAWRVGQSSAVSIHFVGPEGSALHVSRTDGMPERALWMPLGVEWRSVPPRTSHAAWEERLETLGAGEPGSEHAEEREIAVQEVVLSVLQDVLCAEDASWAHPSFVHAVADALVVHVLQREEATAWARRARARLREEYEKITLGSSPPGEGRPAAGSVFLQSIAERFREAIAEDLLEFEGDLDAYTERLRVLMGPSWQLPLRRWELLRRSLRLGYSHAMEQRSLWIQAGIDDEGP